MVSESSQRGPPDMLQVPITKQGQRLTPAPLIYNSLVRSCEYEDPNTVFSLGWGWGGGGRLQSGFTFFIHSYCDLCFQKPCVTVTYSSFAVRHAYNL